MAAAPVRCPDCPGPERGGGGGTPPVPHLGIAVDEGDVLPGALRIVRELRPAWDTATVKTKVRGGILQRHPQNRRLLRGGEGSVGLQSPAGVGLWGCRGCLKGLRCSPR